MKTIEAARGKWPGILRHFGVDEQFLRNKHGPCPMCGGKDRYRFDDKDGTGSYICSPNAGGCGAGDGMKLLMNLTGKTFKEAADAVDEIVNNVSQVEPKPKRDPRKRLEKIQSGLESMDGINPVRRYLHSRGLKPSPITQYHPALEYYEGGQFQGRHPAMIHVFRAPDASPLTYHVTYLTKSGEKAEVDAPKKVMTPVDSLSGGAIRLFKATDTVGIAEGIETAMAAFQRTGVPCWAAYSANLLEQFEPPQSIRRVVVFGDNDASFAGQASSYILARRLKREGLEVDVRIPDQTGADWADQVSA